MTAIRLCHTDCSNAETLWRYLNNPRCYMCGTAVPLNSVHWINCGRDVPNDLLCPSCAIAASLTAEEEPA